jgi:hypothetical protein
MTATLSTKGALLAKRLKEKRRMEKSRNPNPKTPKMMGSEKGKSSKSNNGKRMPDSKKYPIYKGNKFKKAK